MSVQVMFSSSAVFLFMLLLTCCSSGGVVCAEEVKSVSEPSSVELFKKVDTMLRWSRKRVTFFRAHSLVDVNGLMVAFAEANSNCDELCCVAELLSKSLKYEKGKLPSEIIKKEDGNQWMMQAAATNKRFCTGLFGPSAVVKDNKIYVLLSMIVGLRISNFSSAFLEDLELVVGTVATPTDGSPNRITWQPSKFLKDTLKDKLPIGSSRDDLFVLIGRGIVMGDGTILFPLALQNIHRGRNGGCTVISVDNDGKNWNFLPGKIIDKDCVHTTLLEWEGKLLMIPIPSSSSRTRKVYVSTDKGKTWAEGRETDLYFLVDFLNRGTSARRADVMTATINGKNVALLTQRRFIPSGGGSKSRDQVHLFVTDNKRITSVGPVSLDKDIRSDCKLLLTKENGGLFALCNKGPRHSPESVVLFSLTAQLERIKSLLHAWEITDGKVLSPCTSATKEAPCSTPMPTSGLVGFLSNTGDGTLWADEYFGMDAMVVGGRKVENGFKLSGSYQGILWPIEIEYFTQLYSFADRGFTLVATVTIHDIPKSDAPLMSVGLESKTVGLWYGKNGEWKGIINEEGDVATGNWEKDKTYQVVITVMTSTVSAYIDGKRLGSLEPNAQFGNGGMKGRPSPSGEVDSQQCKEKLRHICFGVCPGHYWNYATSSFTVTNAFLYNRVLNLTELPPPPPQRHQSQTTANKMGRKAEGQKMNVKRRRNTIPVAKDSAVSTSEIRNAGTGSSVHVRLCLLLMIGLLAFLGISSFY